VSFGGPYPDIVNNNGFGYRIVATYDDSGRVQHLGLENANGGLDGAKHPKVFSLYVQDKFEREGVVVNGGLRLDRLDVATPSLRNDLLPLGDPNDPSNIPDSLEARDLAPSRVYTRISPRFGIAFPVDPRTIVRFNYGQFY